MGTIYEVEHVHTGQRFALKVLNEGRDGLVERFKREARAVSRIQSDHVIRVTDADVAPELGGAPFLVMELLEGVDLEQATRDAPAPAGEVVAWLRQVARGLDKAHQAGVVHRDLKPANLFLTRRDDGAPLVKILDFGISKVLAEGSSITQSNEFLGSPIYMAPEQTEGRGGTVTFRTDLFALGLIAYRLLAGRIYWTSGTLSQVFGQLLTAPMVPPSQRDARFGGAFDAWFLRACAREADGRFASAHEQIEALAAALGVQPSAPAPPSPTPSSRARPALRRLVVAGGLLAAAVAALLAVASSRGRARSEHAAGEQTPPVRAPVSPPPVVAAAPPPLPASTAAPAAQPRSSPQATEATAKPAGKGRRDGPPRRDPLDGQF
jgi:serine/threonine-protein kinase